MKHLNFLLIGIALFTFACKPKQPPFGQDVVRYLSTIEPKSLHPQNTFDSEGLGARHLLYQPLVSMDFSKDALVGVLATLVPEPKKVNDSTFHMVFEIREAATWDDGSPILAQDVAFSLKALFCPGVANDALKPYLEHIIGFIPDPENERKFTLVSKPYMSALSALSDLWIIPSKVYDVDNYLSKYSFEQLRFGTLKDTAQADTVLQAFAFRFNDEKFNSKLIGGSGPYQLESWESGKGLVFKRKAQWWGDKLDDTDESIWFKAYPLEIRYNIITESSTAIMSLKNKEQDYMRSIPAMEFVNDLGKSDSFKASFNLLSPAMYQVNYIGMKLDHPILQDIKVREALQYATNQKAIAETVYLGLSQPVGSLFPSEMKKYYNPKLPIIPYDAAKATALLNEAGWSDTDGDNVLDKVINGKKTPLRLRLHVAGASKAIVEMGNMYQASCKPIGIDIVLEKSETPIFFNIVRNREFDLYIMSWVYPPDGGDLKQLWHSSSIGTANNYVGLRDAEVDKLLDRIRAEPDEAKRLKDIQAVQEKILAQKPVVLVAMPQNRLALASKFKSPVMVPFTPYCWFGSLKTY